MNQHEPDECNDRETPLCGPRDPKTGRFLVGSTGWPGRPKGSRNKLAEAMIDDLYRDWKAHGIQAIQECRETRPADYLKIVAMIVSKAEDLSGDSEMRDAAVEALIEERRQKVLLQLEKMRDEDGY